jgi:hypothetical protein
MWRRCYRILEPTHILIKNIGWSITRQLASEPVSFTPAFRPVEGVRALSRNRFNGFQRKPLKRFLLKVAALAPG